jgi:hypothetical protein
MQKLNRPAPDPAFDIALPPELVEAIAQEMWVLYGRSGSLDWAAVERHLSGILDQALSDASSPDYLSPSVRWQHP